MLENGIKQTLQNETTDSLPSAKPFTPRCRYRIREIMETIVRKRLADPDKSEKWEDFFQYLIQSKVITDPKILATSVM
jgi:hypothetical protein